jgi:DNA-binding NarL/FixJ family response regulator
MSTKRVILANDSRLLREMLQRVIGRSETLEVAQEMPSDEELPCAIERLDPEWVILSLPYQGNAYSWINACMTAHPHMRFIFFSPDSRSIKMKWQASDEQDLTNLSLNDFIQILERDLQHN